MKSFALRGTLKPSDPDYHDTHITLKNHLGEYTEHQKDGYTFFIKKGFEQEYKKRLGLSTVKNETNK